MLHLQAAGCRLVFVFSRWSSLPAAKIDESKIAICGVRGDVLCRKVLPKGTELSGLGPDPNAKHQQATRISKRGLVDASSGGKKNIVTVYNVQTEV